MDAILQSIGTYGFPIVVALICMYYVKYINDQHKEEMTRINDQHKEEISEVTQAINNNTMALNHLVDKIQFSGGGKDGNGDRT